ncbi:MAG TPA: CheR family methyltransferase, partial [Polyangiaceae bacterium]|nr:CheR family methyltransferase [Polyangiaceae bacterium]
SRRALERAKRAIYPMQEIERMPRERVRRWFERGVDQFDGYARVNRNITSMVRFEYLNLLSDPLPTTRFEVVFLRNVMIYFDAETRQRLLDRVVERLAPGAWLFIGSSETLSEVVTPLELVSPSIYHLPGEG